ncbi:MAG: helicase HerA-like domain-containing protein [Candidatus Micrarchaeota archaeon]
MMSKESFEVDQIALGECGGEVAGIPIRYLTRHGIIAGSTGTGKSRAMQVLAEQLAEAGAHVFVSDVKGDASGFCVPAFEQAEVPAEAEKKWGERNRLAPFEPSSFGANYWSVSDRFARMRFSISKAGSVLFSRLLSLNPTQESHLAIAFSYAKKQGIGLDTPDQLLDVLDELVKTNQRGISPSSVSVIQRKIIALQESGLGRMFGSPDVRLEDLGGLNVLNLSDARNDMAVTMAPAFVLKKLFDLLPEVGEVEKPKFAVFFDEAHYLFKDSNKSLRDLMATILKQIRSKGVAVFFVTQDVGDIPDEILSQLSTKIIFSQKAMTEKGNARLRALVKSFPNPKPGARLGSSAEPNLAETGNRLLETIKTMPPGVALLSTLDESGNQTEPAQVRVFAPATTMAVVPDEALRKATDAELIKKYAAVQKPKAQERPKAPEPGLQAETPRPKAEAKKPAKSETQKTGPKTPKPAPAAPPPVREEVRIKEVVVEKKVVKKSGPPILDGVLGGLLKLLRFFLKAGGMVFDAFMAKPLRALFKYLTKKPIRLLYFVLLLILLYALYVNWAKLQALLEAIKLT